MLLTTGENLSLHPGSLLSLSWCRLFAGCCVPERRGSSSTINNTPDDSVVFTAVLWTFLLSRNRSVLSWLLEPHVPKFYILVFLAEPSTPMNIFLQCYILKLLTARKKKKQPHLLAKVCFTLFSSMGSLIDGEGCQWPKYLKKKSLLVILIPAASFQIHKKTITWNNGLSGNLKYNSAGHQRTNDETSPVSRL